MRAPRGYIRSVSSFSSGPRFVLLLALGAGLAAPSAAPAHVGAGAGDTDVLVHPGDPQARLLEAPWGLVVSAEGDTFDWVCHEVLSAGAGEFPTFEIGPDGTLLGITRQLTGNRVAGESLYRSTDGGCSWDPVQGTTDQLVIAASFDPADPNVALVVTATPASDGAPPTNSLLRSDDRGATFAPVLTDEGRTYRSVAFGPDSVAYALAIDGEVPAAVLLRSDDGGETWLPHAVPDETLESAAFGTISAVDPSDPLQVWLTFDGNIDDGVLRSLDGGESFAPALVPASFVLDLVLTPDGGGFLVGDQRQLWRSDDRATWTLLEGAVQVWGGAWIDGRADFAVNTLAHDEALVTTSTGESFDVVFETLELRGPLACPAESEVAQVCEPLWEDLYRSLELMRPRPSGDDDDSSDPAPTSCEGCATGRSPGSLGSALLLALVLGGVRRRR